MRAFFFAACVSCTQNFGAFEPVDAAKDGVTEGSVSDASTDASGDASGCAGVSFGGHCYFLVAAASFQNSRTACTNAGGHLATFASAAEQMAAQTVGSGDRWIGLYRNAGQAIDANYNWITNEPRTFTNWASGEPNGSGMAVRMRSDGQWADNNESNSYPGVCEKP